ncbi:TPA: hypothetical protein PXM11_004264 [Yersinia enterocolitica]|uniref:hypothetical protein n=1 Tax=Yersinia enterocolitica TaxID=630 RepID=UPI000327E4C3|nr:hypothetical protein [Yersinia enterocolitica]AOF19246.1 hypothetical protein BED34_12215 [Yersinia enterocolitica]AOF23783.1 hypothetical protein BED33_14915 [Yersinia enterocolitica]AOF27423.1 hypothetical protein BED32_11830 [Yersinia enterocolitica]AOF31599.1 hypothetical protein BED35_12685 [Yersinia enterocolitica]AOF35520.1 hypothetical protein BFS78_11770 [Yersinia enterocolitica]
MSENTDYDKACREIARIAAALGIVDYSGDTSEIFDAIIIKDEKHQFIVGETSRVIGERNDIRAAMHRAYHYLMLGSHADAENAIKCVTHRGEVPTPATTQALNEIKAQGVELAAEKAPWLYGDRLGVSVESVPRDELVKFAASLRGNN